MIAEELKSRREKLGLKQKHVAELVGVQVMAISCYERGVRPVPKWMDLVFEALENRRVKELTAGR